MLFALKKRVWVDAVADIIAIRMSYMHQNEFEEIAFYTFNKRRIHKLTLIA